MVTTESHGNRLYVLDRTTLTDRQVDFGSLAKLDTPVINNTHGGCHLGNMDREKRCPQCDFVNLEDAALCISCAEQLPSEHPPNGHVVAGASHTPGQINCTFCTYLNKPGSKICEMCAKTLEVNGSYSHSDHAETESEDGSKMVSCNICTFKNPGNYRRCEMCDSERFEECPRPEEDQNGEAANVNNPREYMDTDQDESMQTAITNMSENNEKRIAAGNVYTEDANESDDNDGRLHPETDAGPMSNSASRANDTVMGDKEERLLGKMFGHVGAKNAIMGSQGDQNLSQVFENNVSTHRDRGEYSLDSTADANESEDNACKLHPESDAGPLSNSASRAGDPVMGNNDDQTLDKMFEHVGAENAMMSGKYGQNQMVKHDVSLSRDPGENHLHSTDDNSLSSFVRVEREDVEDTRAVRRSVAGEQHDRCAKRPDRYTITDEPVPPPGSKQGDITYLIKDACEDMDPAYEDHDQKIRCPRCGAACPNTYEENRKIICKCKFCFCAGCDREYKQDCPTKVECKRGPHCHHPRNCIYYLRNLSLKSLERLLKENNKRYDSYTSWMCEEEKKGRKVKTMHSDHDCKEIFCKPYEEYLIGIIKLYKLDPADVMNEKELETVITRESLAFPSDRSLHVLREFLKSECQLR